MVGPLKRQRQRHRSSTEEVLATTPQTSKEVGASQGRRSNVIVSRKKFCV